MAHPAYEEIVAPQVTYQDPASLDSAEEQRRGLIDEIASIAQQLGDRERRHPDGRRWTEDEYRTWRRRATTALRARESVLRKINAWLQTERRKFHIEFKASQSQPGVQSEEKKLLKEVCGFLQRLKEEEFEFEDDELKLFETLKKHLT